MNPFGIGFLSWDNLGIIAAVVVLLIVFLKDFDMAKKETWVVLLGLTVIGGLTIFQAWRKKKILDGLRAREDDLKRIEKEYADLKDKSKVSGAAYEKASNDLEQAKKDLVVMRAQADKDLAEKLKKIHEEFSNMSADDVIRRAEQLIGS